MNGSLRALALLLLATPLATFADQLIPAGSLLQCTVSEPKLSSKTAAIGDPVLCQVSHVELYGRSVFPTGSYLVGHFEDYKDPGHFVGKGWMELKFDRMTLQPDTVIPVDAKVVYVPHYPVDRDGRIHGNGHPVRDTVEWLIPVLWPIDLINLPRRGPRPTLKAETRLTLKIMDDLVVPNPTPTQRDQYGFSQRAPVSYSVPPPQLAPAAPLPQPTTYVAPPPPPVQQPIAAVPPVIVLVLRSGYNLYASRYWYDAGGRVQYIAPNGARYYIAMQQLDFNATIDVNRRNGLSFTVPVTVGYPGY
jgi:hypothetical protein